LCIDCLLRAVCAYNYPLLCEFLHVYATIQQSRAAGGERSEPPCLYYTTHANNQTDWYAAVVSRSDAAGRWIVLPLPACAANAMQHTKGFVLYRALVWPCSGLYTMKIFCRRLVLLEYYSTCHCLEGTKDVLCHNFRRLTIGRAICTNGGSHTDAFLKPVLVL
jgi:hypothetical protein